jgi:hypothetical protein
VGDEAELFLDQWYGLKLLINPDGKCEVEFNYDPECALDETFFES